MNNEKSIFFKLTGVRVRSIEEITSGFSNLNYKINDSYVLRLPPNYRDPTLNYSQEKAVYESIEKLNISEKITYFNSTTGIKISRFVHNARPYAAYPTKSEIIFVSKALKKLHSAKLSVKQNYDYFHKLETYKKDLSSQMIIDDKVEEKILNNFRKKYNGENLVLCHNDLVRNNLLFKYNGVVLIDWEYASMNSIYFDLASFVSENNLKSEDEVFFLSKYFGYQYTKTKKNIVDIYIKAQDLLFYYWAENMFIKKGDDIYLTIAEDKYRRLFRPS